MEVKKGPTKSGIDRPGREIEPVL